MEFGGLENRLLMKLMSASTLRAKVIANNIANQNVPGYKRQVVRFEELVAKGVLATSADLDRIQPKIETDTSTPSSPDGNNVNMELESNAMRENRLLFDMYASILQGRGSMLEASISERS